MTMPEHLTLQQAQELTRADADSRQHRERVRKMLAGDHWLGGAGWVGPRLPAENGLAAEFLLAVEKQFIPKNALLEVTRRHVGAVIGRYPIIKLALRDATAEATGAQQADMREAEGALTAYLDRNRALGKLQMFTRELLLGDAYLRSYVPTGQLRDGVIPPGDLLGSIARLRLSNPDPAAVRVVDDEETGERYAVYRSKDKAGHEAAEVYYLNAAGQTVVRRVTALEAAQLLGGDGQPLPVQERAQESAGVDMHGLLPITHAEREQFITPTMVRNNFMLNFAKTAILRNAELAAVLERYGVNILPPGEWVRDSNVPDGMRYEIDPAWRPGGGQATFFSPQTTADAQGNVQAVGGGQYGRFEPVSPDALIATKTDAYHDMLDEAAQSHIRMSGDATASGESRIQAMNDFKTSLYATATAIEGALAEHLEMVLAWAAALSGRAGRFRDYRVVVQCRILAAQPTTEERAQVIAEQGAGLRSTENAMSEIGVEDTDEMLESVRKEQEEKLKQGQAAAEALAQFMTPGKEGGNGQT